MEGYLQLIKYKDNSNLPFEYSPYKPQPGVPRMSDSNIQQNKEMQQEIHEDKKKSYWYGTILDMDLNPLNAETYEGTNGHQEEMIIEPKDNQETFMCLKT